MKYLLFLMTLLISPCLAAEENEEPPSRFLKSFSSNGHKGIPLVLQETTPETINAAFQVIAGIGSLYHSDGFKISWDQTTNSPKIVLGDFTKNSEFRGNDLYLNLKGAFIFKNEISASQREADLIATCPQLTLAEFSDCFQKTGTVHLSEYSRPYYEMAGRVIELIARAQERPPAVTLYSENAESIPSYEIYIVHPDELGEIGAILDITRPYTVSDPVANALVERPEFHSDVATMQVFSTSSLKSIFIASDQVSPPFAWAEQLREETLNKLRASTAVYFENQWYAFPFGGKYHPIYLDDFNIQVWWNINKKYIVPLIGVFLLFFIGYIYTNLTEKRTGADAP